MKTFFVRCLDYIQTPGYKGYVYKALVVLALVMATLSIVGAIKLLGLVSFSALVVLVSSAGAWAYFYLKRKKKRPGHTRDDTQEIETDFLSKADVKGMRRHELVDRDGKKVLVTNKKTKFKPHPWSKPTYRLETNELQLDENPLLDTKLVKKAGINPIEGETTVHMCTRLHWWSHGPAQILWVLAASVVTLGAMIGLALSTDRWLTLAFLLIWLTMVLWFGLMYFLEWMKWAYEYLICTNLRLLRVYAPPLGLPGYKPFLYLKDIIDFATIDQPSFSNMSSLLLSSSNSGESSGRLRNLSRITTYLPSWGNLLEKMGLPGYKILRGDSAAQQDAWLNLGIPFVRYPSMAEQIISSARAKLLAADQDRHDAEMNASDLLLQELRSLNAKIPPIEA